MGQWLIKLFILRYSPSSFSIIEAVLITASIFYSGVQFSNLSFCFFFIPELLAYFLFQPKRVDGAMPILPAVALKPADPGNNNYLRVFSLNFVE